MNQQPIEKRSTAQGVYALVEIFPTIQGEGPFVGRPCTFIRLAGCNLQCPLCDTNYTVGRKTMTIPQILDEVSRLMPPYASLVVITGGEPFRQNLAPLIDRLLEWKGTMPEIQIETNGTVIDEETVECISSNLQTTVVCSPKTAKLDSSILPLIEYYKYVVSAGEIDLEDGLPLSCLGNKVRVARPPAGFDRSSIYVQPCDDNDPEKNRRNMAYAADSCLKFGYTLCLQTHKIVGLP